MVVIPRRSGPPRFFGRRPGPSRAQRRPGRRIVAAFALGIAAGTVVLMLPVARAGPGGAPPLQALFTATSALCVTGLTVVDTATYWSTFGQVAILALIQIGGFGVMTLASLLGLLISRRLGLGSRLLAAKETKSVRPRRRRAPCCSASRSSASRSRPSRR